MKCSYHSDVEAHAFCTACNRPLCADCAHNIKSKFFCQDCLVKGAEWAATMKDFRIPADSPKRAALCSIIPGMGAVYNNQYLKALTFFAVFAALTILGGRHEVFGFGAFVFLIFTMFDSYRTAENRARSQMAAAETAVPVQRDKTVLGWGVFLIVLGVLIMLQNVIRYDFLRDLWPLVFILLGAYLVYRAFQAREADRPNDRNVLAGKDFQ